jgi:hypothetical protein
MSELEAVCPENQEGENGDSGKDSTLGCPGQGMWYSLHSSFHLIITTTSPDSVIILIF